MRTCLNDRPGPLTFKTPPISRMTAKDSALFETRAHNFSVLMMEDEEGGEPSYHAMEKAAAAGAVAADTLAGSGAAGSSTEDNDGFETFSSAKKHHGSNRQSRNNSVTGSRAPHAAQPLQTQPFVRGNLRPAGAPKAPKEFLKPTPETTIELFNFSSELKTSHLRQFLQAYEGHYHLKWNHDTSCFVIFTEPSLVERALEELKNSAEIQVQPYVAPEEAAVAEETLAA